jgi:hypothetical protein
MKKIILVLLALGFATTTHAVNLVANHSFEEPSIPQGMSWYSAPTLPGWQVNYGNVEPQNLGVYGGVGSVPHGTQFLELDMPHPDRQPQLVQNFEGRQDGTYSLSFYYSPRPGFGDQELGVFWNGDLIRVVTDSLASSLATLSWRKVSVEGLLSNGSSDVLGFASLKNDHTPNFSYAGGNLIDNVVLSRGADIPEPGTLLLLGSGVIVAFRRRQKECL